MVLVLDAPQSNAQDFAPVARSFSLSDHAQITLTTDWLVRPDIVPPPSPLLIASAPSLVFSELLLLENRRAPAILQIGVSDNPFLGSDAQQLDTRMHERLATDLFYFFFPPPRTCLASAKTTFEESRRKEEERLRKEEEQQEGKKQTTSATARQPIVLSQRCEFSPTPLDFYAAQLSPGVVFRATEKGDRVEGQLRNFYLPPMEQVEIRDKTFFIFEARAERTLERSDSEEFGLPDDRRGMRPYFFWAIGANSPFPFARDPHRKDLELFHVVYACLSLDGNPHAEFRELLERIAFHH